MGTRCLTYVYDNMDRPILNMYRQFDGYPSGHGAELADFLDGMKIVNGISSDAKGKIANGMGCLAAQMIAHFKDDPGGIYIYSVETDNCWQDYEYHVHEEYVSVTDSDGKILFGGTWSGFKDFCTAKEAA